MKKSPLRNFLKFKRCFLAVILVSAVFFLPLISGIGVFAEIKIPPVPSESIYVQDYAGVLEEDTKLKINQLGGEIDAESKAQLVVLTIDSLEGQPLEDYCLAVLRKWQIGDKNLNNGVLLLVALNDRKSRIEVGYGLEGALNDAKTGSIQDKYLIPFLANGEYDKGIYNCYQALADVVAKEYNFSVENVSEINDSEINAFEPYVNTQWESGSIWLKILVGLGILILLIIDWLFLNGTITYLIITLLRSGGGGGGGGSGGGRYGGGSGGGGGSSRNW